MTGTNALAGHRYTLMRFTRATNPPGFAEQHDVAAVNPAKVAELLAELATEHERYGNRIL